MDKLWEQSKGYYGLDETYFNGYRLTMLNKLLQGKQAEVVEEDRLSVYYPSIRASVANCRVATRAMVELRRKVAAYDKKLDMMEFEMSLLNCDFYLTLGDYEMILRSSSPNQRFLYTNLPYKLNGDIYTYEVYDMRISVTQTLDIFLSRMIGVEKVSVVSNVGFVSPVKKYPKREYIQDGQMKIFTDLYKLMQQVPVQNLNILIVGSAAENQGGGNSYEGLGYMVRNSVINMYDPNELSGEYVTRGNNTFKRFRQCFDYSSNLSVYDVVQDDAYAELGRNREVIDPDRQLFFCRVFSSKYLLGDDAYFKDFGKTHLPGFCCAGCQLDGYCDRQPRSAKHISKCRQVGKVSTMEMRIMCPKPTLGSLFDKRFGNCAFCREMFYYTNHYYEDGFFDFLARMHSSRSRCSLKNRVLTPRCDGPITLYGRGYHFVRDIENPVCLPFDAVSGYTISNIFSADMNCTYVFSDIRKIPYYCFYGRVAVYSEEKKGYYVNYKQTLVQREELGSVIFAGVRFRRIKAKPLSAIIITPFADMPKRSVPIIVYEEIQSKPWTTLLSLAHLYGYYVLSKFSERGDHEYYELI